ADVLGLEENAGDDFAPKVNHSANGSPVGPLESSPDTQAEPYEVYQGAWAPDPSTSKKTLVAGALLDIIRVEGPVQVKRVYDVYLSLTEFRRLGKELRASFNAALQTLLDSGEILLKDEDQK